MTIVRRMKTSGEVPGRKIEKDAAGALTGRFFNAGQSGLQIPLPNRLRCMSV
ncbi:MAG: hypothetical protein JXA18_05125 [Chitinispirillaceae bacterium]|nr:hypothetical protein [Chitinispirillaceae bacterium]